MPDAQAPLHWDQGLPEAEAAARLLREGYNELPSSKPRSVFAIGLTVIREPMFALLDRIYIQFVGFLAQGHALACAQSFAPPCRPALPRWVSRG